MSFQERLVAYASGPMFRTEVFLALVVFPLVFIWLARVRKDGILAFGLSATAWVIFLVSFSLYDPNVDTGSLSIFFTLFALFCLGKVVSLPHNKD